LRALCCGSSRNLSGRILRAQAAFREPGRRRFTIAHEIGHYILQRNQQIPCSPRVIEGWNEKASPITEREAERVFASEAPWLSAGDVGRGFVNKALAVDGSDC